jgi:hypothetical protein
MSSYPANSSDVTDQFASGQGLCVFQLGEPALIRQAIPKLTVALPLTSLPMPLSLSPSFAFLLPAVSCSPLRAPYLVPA